MRGKPVPILLSTCQTCRGAIVAQRNLLSTLYTGNWLHLHDEDWSEKYGANPHYAVPTDEDAALLASRRGDR
jgi:hypothetical protein